MKIQARSVVGVTWARRQRTSNQARPGLRRVALRVEAMVSRLRWWDHEGLVFCFIAFGGLGLMLVIVMGCVVLVTGCVAVAVDMCLMRGYTLDCKNSVLFQGNLSLFMTLRIAL